MSERSAYCTTAWDAAFFAVISGERWRATAHPSDKPPWLEFASEKRPCTPNRVSINPLPQNSWIGRERKPRSFLLCFDGVIVRHRSDRCVRHRTADLPADND